MNKAIRVSSLVKKFGRLSAVDDISFDVERGELFAFLGPNGAGKTTTIQILCTLLEKTSGSAEICGLRTGEADAAIRGKIGVVFQENCLDHLLTVRQNLNLRASLYGKHAEATKKNLIWVNGLLGLSDIMDRPYGKLSGGQKRRCEIASALLHEPEILFLDEPSYGLDPQTRCHVWECIEHLRQEKNTTVFLTTHYMEEAAVADHIAIIDGGRIVAQGTPAELRQIYAQDRIKLFLKRHEDARSLFSGLQVDFEEKGDMFSIPVPNSLKALELLKRIERDVASFEVVHGSMEDVFINITGKRLREDSL